VGARTKAGSTVVHTCQPGYLWYVQPMNASIPVLVAIFFGPVSALMASRALDRLREKRKARVELYHTAMSYRAAWLHPDSLRALNNIDIVFSKNKDRPVREAWEKVLAHAYTKRPDAAADHAGAKAWDDRMMDLRVDLYQQLGTAVGFDYGVDYIKTHMYYPQLHVDAEVEWIQIRKLLLQLLSSDELAKRLKGLSSAEELVQKLGTNQVPGNLFIADGGAVPNKGA
jgi:hypothetical protein